LQPSTTIYSLESAKRCTIEASRGPPTIDRTSLAREVERA